MAFKSFSASRQISFHQLLAGARKMWLHDALKSALLQVDMAQHRKELDSLVPSDVQSALTAAGIREDRIEQQRTVISVMRLATPGT